MVQKLYKYQRRQVFFKVLKTIVIIVIIVGAYYAILPVFNKLIDTYNGISQGVTNVQNFGSNLNFPSFGNKNE